MNLTCLLTLLLPMTSQSGDVVVVSAQNGYLINDAGRIVQTSQMFETFPVSAEGDDFFTVVLPSGTSARIHQAQVHSLKRHWQITDDNIDAVEDILGLLRQSDDAEDPKEADRALQQAVRQANSEFGALSTLVAWLEAMRALELAEAGDLEAARALIAASKHAVATGSASNHLLAAEIFNIEGLLDSEVADTMSSATQKFDTAIRISAKILGRRHQDIAVYLQNRSFATDMDTAFEDAVADLKSANSILQQVLPTSAVEHPRGLIALADLFLDGNEPREAITVLTSAFGLLRAYNTEQKIDIATCQLYLGEAWQQREQYVEAERWYSGIDTRLPRAAAKEDQLEMLSLSKEIQHALGDIDFERRQYALALDHYLKAGELIDDDNMETLDGYSYVYAAEALAKLGQNPRAQRLYKGAWLIFEKTDGPESEVALEAKSLYEDAGGVAIASDSSGTTMKAANPKDQIGSAPNDTSDTGQMDVLTDGLPEMAKYAMTIRPGEGMLTTTTKAPIMSGSDVLTTVPSGTTLWSLEKQDTWHKVLVPDGSRRAWVSAKLVDSEYETSARSLSSLVNRKAGDSAAAGRLNKKLLELLPKVSKTMRSEGLAAAVPLQERVTELVEEALGPDSYMTVSVRSQLSTYYLSDRQFIKARKLIEAALPAMRRVHGDDHPIVARELTRLAALLGMIGDEPGRQRCLSEALEIAQTRFGPRDQRVTGLRLNLAGAMTNGGQFAQAEQLLRVVMQTAVDSDDRIASVLAQSALGALRIQERRFEEAILILRQADSDSLQIGDEVKNTRGAIAATLAMALFAVRDLDAADKQLEKAFRIFEKAGQVPTVTELQLLAIKSRIHGRRGDWQDSLSVTNDVLEQAANFFGDSSLQLSGPWTGRGRALVHLGQLDHALAGFDQARRIVHEHVTNTLADLPVSQQIAFLRSNDNPLLHVALSLALKSTENQKVGETTASWLLNSKNIANELAARDQQVRRFCTADRHLESYESWLDGRRRLATLPPLTAEEAQDEHIRETKHNLSLGTEKAFSALPLEAQRFLELRRPRWITVDDVRKKLRRNEVFIDFIRMKKTTFDSRRNGKPGENRGNAVYAAWLISTASVDVIELGNAEEIDQQIIQPYLSGIQTSINKLRELGEVGALAALTDANRALTQRLWLPLKEHLPADTTRLVLCPDSTLWQIPWAAIESEERRLLVEDFTIRFVCSGRDILTKDLPAANLLPPAILADPDYGASPEAIQNGLEQFSVRSLSLRLENVDATLLRQILPNKVGRLPGTASEAAAVQPLLTQHAGMEADVFLRAAASETSLRLTRRPHTLFVGTHGFFLPQEELPEQESFPGRRASAPVPNDTAQKLNPLRRCGLLFAGCSSSQSDADQNKLDGIVTGAEIVGLDLRGTKLVVLSACETGLGDLTDGHGVSGLRQAIQLAGAESVVSTLWEIPDKETTPLMTEFFRNLANGKSRAESLRLAQLNRIQARRDRNGAAHPLFWAAFTVTGRD